MDKKKVSASVALGIFAMYFMISGAGAVSPAIAAFGVAFPDVPQATITMINTLPSLGVVVGTLLMGAVAGKRLPYKACAIFSLIVYLIFGIFPTFFHDSFMAILVTRVIWGFGAGCIAPLGAAVVTNLISDKETRSTWLGRGGAAQQIGCVAMTLLGGFLVSLGWEYTFLAYALALICLIVVVVCYKEDKEAAVAAASEEKAEKGKMEIKPLAWFFVVMFGFAQMICSPTMMNFSNLLVTTGLDVAAAGSIAGLCLSFFVLAGAVGAILLGKFTKALGRYTGPVMFIICAVGMAMVGMGGNVPMLAIGIFVFGFGWCTALPMGNLEGASLVNTAALAMIASLLWAITNVGNFLSSYWLMFIYSIFGENFGTPVLVGAGLFVVLAIIWALVNMKNPVWNEKKDAE